MNGSAFYADRIEGLLANAMRLAGEQSVMVTDAHVSEPSLENCSCI
jgi:hypothetical protein